MSSPHFDPSLLSYLQAWRQHLERMASSATAGWDIPSVPQWPIAAPPTFPPLPGFPAMTGPQPPSADYIQRLLATLQAWRQYLENAPAAVPTPPSVPAAATVSVDATSPVRSPTRPAPGVGDEIVQAKSTTGLVSHTATQAEARIATPVHRVGSAFAPEASPETDYSLGTYGWTAPRSLYNSASTVAPSGPTTTWWEGSQPGRSSATTSSDTPTSQAPQDNSGTNQNQTNGQANVVGVAAKPPVLRPVGPKIPGGNQTVQLPSLNLRSL